MDSTRRGVTGRARGGANQDWILRAILTICGVLLAWTALPAAAQDWSKVPGVAIAYLESPDRWPLLGYPYSWDEAYLGSPSITIMPDGTYIATHDVFGSGTDENTTWVYRSSNKGASWTQLGSISNQFWSTVFQLNGTLYIWGYTNGDNGDIVIRSSHDNGSTWSSPVTLRTGDYGGTANTPVIYNGRIWIAVGGNRVMSASTSSTLLNSSNWTLSDSASSSTQPFGDDWQGWSEGQVVASPQTGVVVLPKIRGLPNTALIRINSPEDARSPQAGDWVSLPGGEKKFGMQYDAVSGRFYALTNVVLPAHANDDSLRNEPEMIRNTGAMLSSKDLVNWDVEQIFLYTSNIDTESDQTGWGEAFQYFQFAIDGNDLAVVSRTALDVGDGQNDPPRGHDSNLITFHVIDDFRTAAPNQYLKIQDGTVNRYERTQHNHAPLGTFALGSTFNGVALTNPNGLSADGDGYVYIREAGGRMLKFDAAGNFVQTVTSLPSGASWTTGTKSIAGPSRDNRSWIKNSNGDWADPLNWFYWGRPDTNEEIATFGSAISSSRTITMNQDFTVKGLHYLPNAGGRYDISGSGTLIMEADTGHALIDVEAGVQRAYVNVWLNDHTNITTYQPDTEFNFYGGLDLHGKLLFILGPGTTRIRGNFVMNGGRLVLDGQHFLSFTSTSVNTLDGVFEFDPARGLPLNVGDSYNLIDGLSNFNGQQFTSIVMPELANLRGWDLSTFYSNGIVKVVEVLSPEWMVDASGDWAELPNWKYRARPDSNKEIVTLGSVITANRTITMNQNYSVKGLHYLSGAGGRYDITGSGTLTLDADSGHALIDVEAGAQRAYVNVKLNDHTNITTYQPSAEFNFYGGLDLNGKLLFVLGPGTTRIRGNFQMNGGRLVLDGQHFLSFASTSVNTLDGTFEFAPAPGLSLALGAHYNLIDGLSNFNGQRFTSIVLPELDNLLGWNYDSFYSNGEVDVIAVLSPEWAADANGNWLDSPSWKYRAKPDSNLEVASFKAINTATRYAYINAGQTVTVKGLDFDSPNRYVIDGDGALTLQSGGSNAVINVRQGSPWIRVDTRFSSNVDAALAAGTELSFRDTLNLNGAAFSLTGGGRVSIADHLTMNGGRFVVDGLSKVVFNSTSAGLLNLNGYLQFAPAAGIALTAGSSYDLIDGESYLSGATFNSIVLPTAPDATGWDTGSFYSDGKVKLISVPAPTWTKASSGNWTDAINWLYSCRPDSNLEIATFASATASAATVTLNSTYAVKGLRFNSTNKYTLGGSGAINLDADTGHAVLDVLVGNHEVQVPLKLYDMTDATLAANTALRLSGSLNLNGQTLNVSGPGTLTVAGPVQCEGATINLQNNSTVAFSSGYINLTSGTVLSGNGMVNSLVFNGGRVSPGESTGTLWMVGGYGQSASGQLDIEITYAGQHDSVVVLGGASLSGKLKLTRLDGYVPTRGASFTVLTAQSVSGQFATIEGLTVNSNLSLAVTYTGTSVLVTAALPGDANLDGKINLADLQILGDHWNGSSLSWSLGDFNGDGKVNLSDLQIVGDHWSGSAADFAAFAATIPEPGGVGMALCLVLIAPGRRYRRVRGLRC